MIVVVINEQRRSIIPLSFKTVTSPEQTHQFHGHFSSKPESVIGAFNSDSVTGENLFYGQTPFLMPFTSISYWIPSFLHHTQYFMTVINI